MSAPAVSGKPRQPIATVPVGLRVEGRLVLVVGAGRIAARKALAYQSQGAILRVVAPEWSPEMEAIEVVDQRRRSFEPADLDDAWFAVTATGDPAIDGAVFNEAEARRIWCNAADDPANCSVILPAVVRREPITISIATGGTSPASATWLRGRIESLLDESTMAAIDVATQVRDELRQADRPTEIDGWQEALQAFEADLRTRVGLREEVAQA